MAVVEVLEDAGFEVIIPEGRVCCGRPLYDYGFLGMARSFLEDTLKTLRLALTAGIPIVGVEPSCVALFRDELPKMLPDDHEARHLSRLTYNLGGFLAEHAPEDWSPPRLDRRAVVHGHCHHKNLPGGMDGQQRLLERLGLDFEILDSGCCGMAGSFGIERGERYDVSVASGERVLLPAVREAADDTLIVADGFSCSNRSSSSPIDARCNWRR